MLQLMNAPDMSGNFAWKVLGCVDEQLTNKHCVIADDLCLPI